MFSLQKRQLKEDMIADLKYLNDYHKDEGKLLFSLCVKDRIQSSGFKLQQNRFSINTGRKSSLLLRQ